MLKTKKNVFQIGHLTDTYHTSVVRVSVSDKCWTRDTPLMRHVQTS